MVSLLATAAVAVIAARTVQSQLKMRSLTLLIVPVMGMVSRCAAAFAIAIVAALAFVMELLSALAIAFSTT